MTPPSVPLKVSSDRTHATPPPSRTGTPVVPSSSRSHWNQLRNAIVPGSPVPSSRSLVSDTGFPQPAPAAPPRSQTPKPSRLARLGFRQIVEHTREIIHDEVGRFETDIYQACTGARFSEARQRVEREGSQPYLPFMSTTSLPLSTISTASQQGRSGLSSELSSRAAPSLKPLHQTLVRYASISGPHGTIARLPYEAEVLSVLFLPFAVEVDREAEERWLAVETFEIAVKTWRASSQQRETDRILWCCKAALIPASPVRSRVLGALSNLLFCSTPVQDGNPLALQNILQGLLLLLHAFSKHPSLADVQIVRDLCVHVTSGACGELDIENVGNEYGEEWGSRDNQDSIRAQIVAESVVRCMQSGSESLRHWTLHESIETYWPPISESLSPLCKKIMARRLSAFLRSALSLLRLDTTQGNRPLLKSDSIVIIRILQHRALAELEQLPVSTHTNDSRALVVELLVELLATDAQSIRLPVVELICSWWNDVKGWRESLESGLRLFIEKAEWTHLSNALRDVIEKIPDDRSGLVTIIIPALHTRLVVDAAPFPLASLTSLLRLLAELHPQQFYKPLFSLAGASRDPTIVGHLSVVSALARHLPEFWIRDSEMVSVALMSDIGSAVGKGKAKEGHLVPWAKLRIGQSLIMLELIRCVKALTNEKKDPTSAPDSSQAQAYRFVTGLEARLSILLEAKEKGSLVPFSQRILLSSLFLEIRLFSRSLKPAPWLSRIVMWAVQSYLGANLQTSENPFSNELEPPHLIVGDEDHDEVISTFGKIHSIYVACWQSPTQNTRQRSTMLLSTSFDPRTPILDQPEAYTEAIKEREELMTSLSTGVASATLNLLVAVCSMLTHADHRLLGPVLWSRLLDDTDPYIVAPACFLMTYCLEKSPKDAIIPIQNDIHRPDSTIKRTSIRRLMTLFAWRTQLLSQTYLYDRGRRRPFKLARQPIAFVALDVGSGNYVHEQTEEDRKNLPGGSLPFELRKRLAEVGWNQDDQPTDTRLEKVRAPFSLFPITQLDHLNTVREQSTISPSRSADGVKQLLRRKSSATGQHLGTKRRPVFVPVLVQAFSSMSSLAVDSDPIVASAARDAILLMLRDDPAMLCRPIMDTLSGDLSQAGSAVSTLRTFLHVHNRMPPSASQHIFSHLGGFLKHISRDSDDPNTFTAFSHTVPLLSKLINQVSNLSIRDLRRSKFEIYVFPSGSLWFPPTAPMSSMFPQSLGPVANPFDELPSQLMAICMLRTAQNMLLLDMLKHKPQETQVIRKSLTGLVLPGENTGKELDLRSFIPRRSHDKRRQASYKQVSLVLSRSYLLLLGQAFRSMPRNFNGRAELARLFDGLNRILLAHGDDIGIVTHALIACMIAITRFRRLISSSRGFILFMPSILKVYAEAECHAGIRHAIQYASSRFYAIHEEAYLFQSLDLASNILVRLDHSTDQDWFAGRIWSFFSYLKASPLQALPDAAGIRDINRMEERDALIAHTVTGDISQTTSESSGGEQLNKILAMGQYENKILQLDDLVKLFLTVIAHDPTVKRSQNFLILFRRMAPDFYNGSKSARSVLRDGIGALGSALFVKTHRQKTAEANQARPSQYSNVEAPSHDPDDAAGLFDDHSSPNDHLVMRREYLGLLGTFVRNGGDLRQSTVRRALDLVKGLLKEPARPEPEFESDFLQNLTGGYLSRLGITAKHALTLLQDVAPVIRAFALSMDCSAVLDSLTQLLKRPELASDASLVQFVVEEIVGPVLEACEDAASENLLMSLPMRRSVISLVSHAATLGGDSVAGVIEKQSPSPGFLAGIVLPLCLTLKTSSEIATENQRQGKDRVDKQGVLFIRLLAYAMDACRLKADDGGGRSSPLPALNRRDSERSKRSSVMMDRTPLAMMATVILIIKAIIVRAEDDLSNGLTSVWVRLARFLQQLLADGDASFALPSILSPDPSPLQSPNLSSSFNDSHGRPLSDRHNPPSPSASVSAPRVVDYLTWSLLEFLCCAPSPLTLQMRLWMQEKVYTVDTQLKATEVQGPSFRRRSRRISSSVFARPRGSSMSPDALRGSRSLSAMPSELNLSASTDFSAYNRFPSSPAGSSLQPSWGGPRILHLGPTKDPPMFHRTERSSSQDGHLKNLARNACIGQPSLIRSTRDRIRVVQTFMGYDRLLPMDGGESSEVNPKTWSKISTLVMIAEEATLITEEFPEKFHESLGGEFVDIPSTTGVGEMQATGPNKKPILF
ncbi:hypothetical protein K439DRAFT_1349020 [Ramaria rubella]|nr:hypothetical protein K439DRAFT_1349020 [Ramaria rubella]